MVILAGSRVASVNLLVLPVLTGLVLPVLPAGFTRIACLCYQCEPDGVPSLPC